MSENPARPRTATQSSLLKKLVLTTVLGRIASDDIQTANDFVRMSRKLMIEADPLLEIPIVHSAGMTMAIDVIARRHQLTGVDATNAFDVDNGVLDDVYRIMLDRAERSKALHSAGRLDDKTHRVNAFGSLLMAHKYRMRFLENVLIGQRCVAAKQASENIDLLMLELFALTD